jgi:quercetin dioxygenase-like cupin family protein
MSTPVITTSMPSVRRLESGGADAPTESVIADLSLTLIPPPVDLPVTDDSMLAFYQASKAIVMSSSKSQAPVIVTAAEAEVLGPIGHYLRADSPDTGGALSAHRIKLGGGADGATPHRHDHSSELFFVIDGALDVLVDAQARTVHTGDLLVVPPGLPHAFAAHRDSPADALIVITPGIERFEYLRQVARIRTGQAFGDSLLSQQDRYDTHFPDSEPWQQARRQGSVASRAVAGGGPAVSEVGRDVEGARLARGEHAHAAAEQ